MLTASLTIQYYFSILIFWGAATTKQSLTKASGIPSSPIFQTETVRPSRYVGTTCLLNGSSQRLGHPSVLQLHQIFRRLPCQQAIQQLPHEGQDAVLPAVLQNVAGAVHGIPMLQVGALHQPQKLHGVQVPLSRIKCHGNWGRRPQPPVE